MCSFSMNYSTTVYIPDGIIPLCFPLDIRNLMRTLVIGIDVYLFIQLDDSYIYILFTVFKMYFD